MLFFTRFIDADRDSSVYQRRNIQDDGLLFDELPVEALNAFLEEDRFMNKREISQEPLDIPEAPEASLGKIVNEEETENSDPDGDNDAQEGSSDVSGSGYQRDNVMQESGSGSDVDGDESENRASESKNQEPEDENKSESNGGGLSEIKRQFIAHPNSRYRTHPGFVYLKAPPIQQRTIVTTHIPRPPMIMSYKAFLNKMMHDQMHGLHSPYRVADSEDEDYDHEREEGMCLLLVYLILFIYLRLETRHDTDSL